METQFSKIGNIWSYKTMTNEVSNQEQQKTNIMKTIKKPQIMTLLVLMLISFSLNAQVGAWNPELVGDSEEALHAMLQKTPKLQPLHNEAYGYAVFPRVTKAGIAIGGALGKGIVFKDHQVVGSSKLKQVSLGIQFGGQQYSEIIFFENKEAFDLFTNGKLKFDAQASAVVLKAGASIDAAYQDGVAVFTMTKGGFMYEASVGGQHFKFKAK